MSFQPGGQQASHRRVAAVGLLADLQTLGREDLTRDLIGSRNWGRTGIASLAEPGERRASGTDRAQVHGESMGLDDHRPTVGELDAPHAVDAAGAEPNPGDRALELPLGVRGQERVDLLGCAALTEDRALGPADVIRCEPRIGGRCGVRHLSTLAPVDIPGLSPPARSTGVDQAIQDGLVSELTISWRAAGGVETAWHRYWRPLFGPDCDEEIVAAARNLALQQSVDDLITGVRAFHDRRDHTVFAHEWPGQLMLVNGAQDLTPRPTTARADAPSAHQLVVEDCGHFVPLERPRTLERLLASLLRRSA